MSLMANESPHCLCMCDAERLTQERDEARAERQLSDGLAQAADREVARLRAQVEEQVREKEAWAAHAAKAEASFTAELVRLRAQVSPPTMTISDHEFVPSRRTDSCDYGSYPVDGPWTGCDYPEAAHSFVTDNARLRAQVASLTAELEMSQGNYATLRSSQRVQQQEYEDQERQVASLQARVVMLLKCHYEEHKHIGSPTCFDVQAPTDMWESHALAALPQAPPSTKCLTDDLKLPCSNPRCTEHGTNPQAPPSTTVDPGLIPLNQEQLDATKQWPADDRLWTTQETVEINLRTFARVVLQKDSQRAHWLPQAPPAKEKP